MRLPVMLENCLHLSRNTMAHATKRREQETEVVMIMMTILAVEVLKFKDKLIMIFARKNVNSFSYLLPHVATGCFFSENHKNHIYVCKVIYIQMRAPKTAATT